MTRKFLALPSDDIRDVQTGIPDFFSIDSPTKCSLYFDLLRQWLKDCDQRHQCHQRAEFRPTRLIEVGDLNSNNLRLVEKAKQDGPVDYLALSHCWGGPTQDEKEEFCTTPRNIQERLKEFTCETLPKTFQDAISVTRKLGIPFLWIDSLCIIQFVQEKDSKSDWERESKLMERVFSSAYCTISATSAAGWQEGFLERKSTIPPVRVQDVSGNTVYVCNNVDNFSRHVEEGKLNTRGWVLQERVLSRRNIHFTEKHTYWECGKEVRYENFTRMPR